MLGALLTLIVYLLVLGLLFWLAQYLLQIFPLPDPLGRVVQALIIVVAVLIAIVLILDVFGAFGGASLPHFSTFGRP